jgi:hypothetical protein
MDILENTIGRSVPLYSSKDVSKKSKLKLDIFSLIFSKLNNEPESILVLLKVCKFDLNILTFAQNFRKFYKYA